MDGRLLIVDDDQKLQDLLRDYLVAFGFQVEGLADARQLEEKVAKGSVDLIILDVMLPGVDGLEALRRLRARSQVPVLMLTARGDDTDRIVGLELGADDYLAKPFNPRELLARVRAILRRTQSEETEPSSTRGTPPRMVQSDGLTLDRFGREARAGGVAVSLSSAEAAILEVLMQHPNETLSRDAIMNHTRGRDFMAYERSIDVHVSRIRAKLSELPGQSERIRTVWGQGYDRDRLTRFGGVALSHAELLREALRRRVEGPPANLRGRLVPFVQGLSRSYEGRVWLLVGDRVLADSGSGPPPAFPMWRSREVEPFRISFDLSGNFLIRLPVEDVGLGPAALLAQLTRRKEGPGELLPLLLGLALAFVVLSVPVSRLITRRLAHLRDSALQFADGRLSLRAQESGRDEIGELAHTFNIMADRIERMIAAQKDLSAHVSHELRSPLARIRLAEELLRRALPREAEEARRRLDSIRSEVELLDGLVGRILQYAALEARTAQGGRADAGSALNEAIARFLPLFEAAGLRLHLSRDGDSVAEFGSIPVQGPADLLTAAFAAACDNCVRHALPDSVVHVSVHSAAGGVRVNWRNRAKHVPADLESIFRPFQRGTEHSDGHGLGLALLRKATELCEGTVRAHMENGDFVLEMHLPPPGEAAGAGLSV